VSNLVVVDSTVLVAHVKFEVINLLGFNGL